MESILADIAAKTGDAIPHITDLVLRGIQFEGIYSIIASGVMFILGAIGLCVAIRINIKTETVKVETATVPFIVVCAFVSIAGFVGGCTSGFLSSSSWMKATAPDVYVVNQARHKILDGHDN